jgi:hypothetical protein
MASNPIFNSLLSMFDAVISLARKKTISIHGDNGFHPARGHRSGPSSG